MPGMLPTPATMPQPWRSETPDEIYRRAVDSERRDNHADAADLYQEAAIRGHLSAMVALGRHLIGLDDRTSVGWFRAAAERGHPTAWTELGHMYARGYGVERSNPHAVACWQRGAMLGDIPARSCLGLSYIQGFGVEKDPEKGIGIVRQVAESGDVISMRNLAWVYRTGRGVPKNTEEADFWDQRAARAGPISHKPVLHPTASAAETASAPAASVSDEIGATGEPVEEQPEEGPAPVIADVIGDGDDQDSEEAEMLDALDGIEEAPLYDAPMPEPVPDENAPDTAFAETKAASFRASEVTVQGANIPPKATDDSHSEVKNLKLVDNTRTEGSALFSAADDGNRDLGEQHTDRASEKPSNTSFLPPENVTQPSVTYLKLVPVTSQPEKTYIATETTEDVFEDSPNPVIAVVRSPMDAASPPTTGDIAPDHSSQAQGQYFAASPGSNLETLIELKEKEQGVLERSEPPLGIATPKLKGGTPEPASPKRSVPYVTTAKQGSFWGSPGRGQTPGTATGLEVVDSALTKLKSGSSMNSSLGLSSFSSIPHTKVRETFPKNGSSPSALEGPGFAFQQVVERPIEPQEKRTVELGSSSRRDMERKLSRESIPLEVHPARLKEQEYERRASVDSMSRSSTASEEEDGLRKRPSALEAARRAIRHHSRPARRVSSSSLDNMDDDEGSRNDEDKTEAETEARKPVSAVVAHYERKELQAKGLLPEAPPPPPPPPPPPRPPPSSLAASPPKPIPLPPIVVSSANPDASVFQRRSGFMTEIESTYSKFPNDPENADSRQAVYNFVDVTQRLRAEDTEEGAYLVEKRAWDVVVAAMFAQPQDVCIQERSLHALIRLLRFIPNDEKEHAVLRSCGECFTGLPYERMKLPFDVVVEGSGALQAIIFAMRNFPSTRLVQMAGCAALADLSEVCVESRIAAVDLGAIAQISLTLEQGEGNVMSTVYEMACRAISAICSGPDMVNLKQAMAEQRIVEEIVAGLDRWTGSGHNGDEYLLFATRSGCAALRRVCTLCREACLHALNSNVFRSLTHSLNVYMGDTATCTVAIAAIIAIATSLGEMAEAGLHENRVLPAVLTALTTHAEDALLVRKALMCLETLSACKLLQKSAVEQGTVEATVKAADNHKTDARVQEQACSTLERLSHYCTPGKDAVAASNGMHTISRALMQHADDIGVVERAALAASSTCINHSVNQNSALQLGIAAPVVEALGKHGRANAKLVIACSTAITALAQAKDPVMGNKMARKEAPEHLISAMQCHIESADVVEHTVYAIATLCVADGDLPDRLTKLSVEKPILKAFQMHITTSRCVLAILSAIRVLVSKPNRLRLQFMTDQSTGTGLSQLIHETLVHHMNPFPESNMVVLICGTLNFLAFECVPHKNEIGSTGIFEQLGDMILYASEEANVVGLQPSLATICTLVLNSQENQDRFLNLNGVEVILELMKKWHKNPKVLEHCCIALRYSCNQHLGNCDDMKRLHGVKSLVAVMRSHLDDPRLFEMACLALAVLCQGDKEIQESPTVSEAIKATCEAMQAFPGDPVVQVAACTLFLSATFENEANKKRVVRYGGRTAIVSALESHPGHLELAEAGAYALLHVEDVEVPGVNRPDLKKASDEILNSGRRDRRAAAVPKVPSQGRLSLSRRKSRDGGRIEAAVAASHGDRAIDGLGNNNGEDVVAAVSPKPSRGRSRRNSKQGDESEAQTAKKPAGSRSFLRFGRSRSKKNIKPSRVADEQPVEPESGGEYEGKVEGRDDEQGRLGHTGYSEGYDVHVGHSAEVVLNEQGIEEDNEEEDVYDRLHATHNDQSTVTGSGNEFYSMD